MNKTFFTHTKLNQQKRECYLRQEKIIVGKIMKMSQHNNTEADLQSSRYCLKAKNATKKFQDKFMCFFTHFLITMM